MSFEQILRDPRVRQAAARLRSDRDSDDMIARVTWSVITEPGDGTAGAVAAQLGVLEGLRVAFPSSGELREPRAASVRDGIKRWMPRLRASLIAEAFENADRVGAQLLFPDDKCWPRGMDDLGEHAPHVLWVKGNPRALVGENTVAIVGARAATAYGEHMATELAADLAQRGTVVVSGGAYGIDGAAHRAALRAGGATVAFLAGGVDRIYPVGHTQLLSRIVESGALVSEVPCGTAPTKWRFLARNRLISAMAGATVVVEAGWRSGSLNTAGHASSLGRALGAVPGPVTSAASAGCHRLLREYDARCVTSADDVRELLGLETQHHHADSGSDVTGSQNAEVVRLMDALSSRTTRSTLEIAQKSGLAPDRIEALLGILLLEGDVSRSHDGWRRPPST